MTHAHITSWAIALILFFIAVYMQKGRKTKPLRIVQMVLRLFYLLILGTGLAMLFSIYTISIGYILKAVLGLWVIAMMEMILIRGGKEKATKSFWVQFLIAFLIVLYLGFSLPLGFKFF